MLNPDRRISTPGGDDALSILLLCDDDRRLANTVRDHIEALTKLSRHRVCTFNPCGIQRTRWLDFDEFDVVALHYSLRIISDHDLAPWFRERLRRFQGLKVQFLQDEYRWVDRSAAAMRDLGIGVLFTLLPPSRARGFYNQARLPCVELVTTLAGYVPEALRQTPAPPLSGRPIDIGYRGRTLPFWLGRLAQEKHRIGREMAARAPAYGLRCDIAWSEQARLYGAAWNRFLASCKATLGTESGASITDFDGSIERRTKAYLAEHPDARFEEVHAHVLAPYEDNFRVSAVSPRVFEAAALRTALILFPGEYSGLLQPWTHYIPLQRDFSNLAHVADCLRDHEHLQALTDRAYADLVASGRYGQRAFTREFDEVVAKYGVRRAKRSTQRFRLVRAMRPFATARRRTRVWARPALRLGEGAMKAIVAWGLLLARPPGRLLLRHHLWRSLPGAAASLPRLLRDVLKLAVVGQARGGGGKGRVPYDVHVEFDRQTGHLRFTSQPNVDGAEAHPQRGREDREAVWAAVAEALERQNVRRMVWNHASPGGPVRYRLVGSLDVQVQVGDDDFHAFDSLLRMAELAPDATRALVLDLLKAPLREEKRAS